MPMKINRAVLAVPLFATLLALSACGDRVENTEMPQPDQPSVEVNRRGMEGASRHADAETHRGATAIMGGVGNGSVENGVSLDARIATEVREALKRDGATAAAKIDVNSHDGLVTLNGQAPDPAARERADQITRNIKDVKSVENLLTVG